MHIENFIVEQKIGGIQMKKIVSMLLVLVMVLSMSALVSAEQVLESNGTIDINLYKDTDVVTIKATVNPEHEKYIPGYGCGGYGVNWEASLEIYTYPADEADMPTGELTITNTIGEIRAALEAKGNDMSELGETTVNLYNGLTTTSVDISAGAAPTGSNSLVFVAMAAVLALGCAVVVKKNA